MANDLPVVLFEDEHLLVVNKPAGWNTHAPGPYAGEGIYDWLRHREPRWARLAIIHRLDKETSGVLVFSKTAAANRSLAQQFAAHRVRKRYVLWTDRPVEKKEITVVSGLERRGGKYLSRPVSAENSRAETRFRVISRAAARTILAAEPVTGRTHQIRAHAAARGFPALGDALYGGTAWPRVCLHAEEIAFRHPASGEEVRFSAAVDFTAEPRAALRAALLELAETDIFRLVHGAADGWPGWYVDRAGDWLMSQSEADLSEPQRKRLEGWLESYSLRGAYHKTLNRRVRQAAPEASSPRLVLGEEAPPAAAVRENGLRFEIRFGEGYSIGLFPDQRDNRWRVLRNYLGEGFQVFPDPGSEARPEVLNTFAYTCGFSACAAKAGARVTSVDLSKKYLEWGKRNFQMNGLDPAEHDFIYGEVFEWLRRLGRKGRRFDAVFLDPPTFSTSKKRGVFQVTRHYGRLIQAALPLLKPEGVLCACSNAAGWPPEKFVKAVLAAVGAEARRVVERRYFPQTPDFPVSREEPAYLKSMWLKLAAAR